MDKSVQIKSPIHKMCGEYENFIYVKREDLLPLYFGGNKARIAEAFAYDAEQKGCDCILTYGSSDSNMCRAITMICRKRNIDCRVLSAAEDDEEYTYSFNSEIAEMAGFPFYTCHKNEVAASLEKIISEVSAEGKKVYYIFDRENIPAGIEAYKNTFKEISDNGAEFDYIFLASGTGITQAGLVCGQALLAENAPCKCSKIVGISISRDAEREIEILHDYVDLYMKNKVGEANKEVLSAAHEAVNLTDSYRRGGYGKYDADLLKKISVLLYNEGIGLDPVYSGKAFFGMIDYLKDHGIKGKKVLFINTGSSPLFFDRLQEINQ